MTIHHTIAPPGCGCDAAEHVASLISIDEALGRIARLAVPVACIEPVPLLQAGGRVLAESVRATGMTPPFDNAAMDGYAVDTTAFTGQGPWTLPVISRVPAGATASEKVGRANAARIFTGAPLPREADAVIRQEDAKQVGAQVTFDQRPQPGLNIRQAGGDMQPGQIIGDNGAHLGPREIAACAAAGAGTVGVRRKLRVAVLVTGNEIRTVGAGREAAEIWDVNTPMLCAGLSGPPIDLFQVEQVADCRASVEHSLARLVSKADLIVTTGGVSVGEEDHVKPALGALGAVFHFNGVAIKPGKPISYGQLGSCHWLGLPGNPLSAYVTWQIFGTALIRGLTGQGSARVARRHVVTADVIRRKPGRCEFRPATIVGFDAQGREVVAFEAATHSGRVRHLAKTDGLVMVPGDRDDLPTGALLEFVPFSAPL